MLLCCVVYAECRKLALYAESHNAECRGAHIIFKAIDKTHIVETNAYFAGKKTENMKHFQKACF